MTFASGMPIPCLSPSDLIFLKQVSWRDEDKLDVLAMKEFIARESRSVWVPPAAPAPSKK